METNNTATTMVETTTIPDTEPSATPTEDVVTLSQEDYSKALQSAEDRVRGKYVKQVKQLEDKIAELTPAQKTDAEIELENRLAALEAKEKETAEKERLLSLRETLQGSGIDQSIADFLKSDVDVDSFVASLTKYTNDKISTSGYKPTGHRGNQDVSVAEWKAMKYDEREKLYETNPTLAEALMRGRN